MSRQSFTSSRLGPAQGPKSGKIPSRPPLENLQRYHQDIGLLNQKLTDLQQKAGAGSSFVSNMRSNSTPTESQEGTIEDKIKIIETVLAKVSELDRIVLQNTEIQKEKSDIKPVRRNSRGMDLFTVPTHLHLVDRLMKYYKVNLKSVTLRTSILILFFVFF